MKTIYRDHVIYYEIDGSGEPILFLHGNQESLTIFDELTNTLKEHFSVYRMDSRHHGKSGSKGPLNYTVLRDDLCGFIHALGLYKPHVLGFSDGGIAAMMAEIQYPGLFRSMTLLGVNTRPKGIRHKERQTIQHEFSITKNKYDRMMLKGPFITKKNLRAITCPVLLVSGENDVILESHTKMIHRHLQHSVWLKIMGHDHGSYLIHQDILANDLLLFLKKT